MYQLNWDDISEAEFLAEYWQQKPLLIRNAFAGFETLISPDEMAGLSCEEEVESRIIVEKGLDNITPWQVFHGPQEENIFSQLPDSHWTLLLQEANQHIPELAPLIDCFNFIPNWRFDDVMISYAEKGGSVGPHTDQYDVFLLQAHGQRHWHLADKPTNESDLIEDIECRILKDFQLKDAHEDWVLNPGDMLYLPPNIIHHGIALNECMTYSMGYRAPTATEILSSLLTYMEGENTQNKRYSDPKLKAQLSNGEISQDAIAQLINNMQTLLSNKEQMTHFIAQNLTETASPDYIVPDNSAFDEESIKHYLDNGGRLQRNESFRFAFTKNTENEMQLYVNGEQIAFDSNLSALIPIICGNRIITNQQLQNYLKLNNFYETLSKLVAQEYFYTI